MTERSVEATVAEHELAKGLLHAWQGVVAAHGAQVDAGARVAILGLMAGRVGALAIVDDGLPEGDVRALLEANLAAGVREVLQLIDARPHLRLPAGDQTLGTVDGGGVAVVADDRLELPA